MSSRFNPYSEWFGLNTSTKPTYYDLLGVPNFETEPPVIAEAAELRLQLLEPHKSGPHSEQAERLSREVAGVMNVLLSPEKRRQYDDQLRQQAAAAMPAQPAALPPTVEATDSPTMMLPPGSFSLPPMTPAPAAQQAPNPYGAYPGYGAPQQPAYAGPPGYPSAPQMPMMMPPTAPQYAPAAAAYPPAASPYAQQAAPVGYAQGYPPAAQPAYAAPAAQATMATGGGATFAANGASQRTRMAGARKQKSSHTTMATAIIGGAAVVLAIVIIAVASSMNKPGSSTPQPKVIAKKPNHLPQDLALTKAEQMVMAMTPLGDPETGSGYTYRSTPDEVLRNEARMRDMIPTGTVEGFPPIPTVVQSMAPAGVTPSIATPAPMPMASATGTPPTFTVPTPPPATPAPVPVATATATAMPAPSAPAAPVIAGLAPTEVAMEAVLPADAARAKSVQTMLGAARKLIKARDYGKAEEIILQTQVMADTPALITATYEHGRVIEHIRVFWTAVREGAKSLAEGEELTYAGKVVKVVKHDDLTIVVKQDNKDVVLQIDKLLPGVAVILAERGLPAGDMATKLALASFLASDQAGDRERAMLLLSEVGAMGTDVANLKAALSDAP